MKSNSRIKNFSGHIRRRFRAWDWRFYSIALATCISIVLTVVLPIFLPTLWSVQSFYGAVFASWAAGVALFALVGFIVALASLSRPEQESFDARARNFLRRQSGGHIDYIVKKLGETLEPYVESSTRRMIIQKWNEAEKKFQIRQETIVNVRGFLDDIESKFPARLAYKAHCKWPEGENSPSLSYIKVNGETIHGFLEFEDEFAYEFEGVAPKNSTCPVEHAMTYWVEASTEPNRARPTRFVRSMEVIIENKEPRHSVIVKVVSGASQKEFRLDPGDQEVVIKQEETIPGEYSYDFRLELGPSKA